MTGQVVRKDVGHFLRKIHSQMEGPVVLGTWRHCAAGVCPSSLALAVGRQGMTWAWVPSYWCVRQLAPVGLRTSGSLWLASQGYARGAAGRPLGPQLPSASCPSFCFSFSVSVLAACQPCTPVWELNMPAPRSWASLPPHGRGTCPKGPAVPL